MRKTLTTLAAVVAGGALSLANAAQQPPAPAQQPAPAQAPTPPAPDAAAADPAVALIQGRCAMCHSADFVLQARKPKAAWRDLVNEMVSRGAQVNDAEADQITAYLEKNQSAPPAP